MSHALGQLWFPVRVPSHTGHPDHLFSREWEVFSAWHENHSEPYKRWTQVSPGELDISVEFSGTLQSPSSLDDFSVPPYWRTATPFRPTLACHQDLPEIQPKPSSASSPKCVSLLMWSELCLPVFMGESPNLRDPRMWLNLELVSSKMYLNCAVGPSEWILL